MVMDGDGTGDFGIGTGFGTGTGFGIGIGISVGIGVDRAPSCCWAVDVVGGWLLLIVGFQTVPS